MPVAYVWFEDAIAGSHKAANPHTQCGSGLRITKFELAPVEVNGRAKCPVCDCVDLMEGQGKAGRPAFLCGAAPNGERCGNASRIARELYASGRRDG